MLNELRILTFDSKRDNWFCWHIISISHTIALRPAVTTSRLPIVNAATSFNSRLWYAATLRWCERARRCVKR